jgi:UDP-N-acetylglucosamine 4,6-dehydratase
MFNKKTILITGGTGSFGKNFCSFVLEKYKPKKLIIYSRDELKQREMKQRYEKNYKNIIRFFIGDVRDLSRLIAATKEVDILIHAAALKQIDTAEYNPLETIKTNILGAQNVIEASFESKIKKVIALSTDKAAQPISLYGATKLVSDKLFISANNIKGNNDTIFSVVRYGNVIGSRGSIIPLFKKISEKKDVFPLTDVKMTRFFISIEESVKFVVQCLELMNGGEIFIPKIPSFKIIDLIKSFSKDPKIKIIGIRPGEKLYETMCPNDEVNQVIEFKKYFVITPSIKFYETKNNFIKNSSGEIGKKVSKDFEYNSNNNNKFLTIPEIKKYLHSAKVN